jgi:REP element-mobilizing transposase RayT
MYYFSPSQFVQEATMPRMMRFEFPGSLVHIMARGIDGKVVFADDEDRGQFLAMLRSGIAASGYRCLAWCLMDNHYHLLLRTNENRMSAVMRPLNGGYARWFNRKYSRRGYLFQDRYKSVLCQDQEYALQLIRYIHLNPLRGGQVQSINELKSYRWCGHGFFIGVQGALGDGFQHREEALRRFGADERDALRSYQEFLARGIDSSDLQHSGQLTGDDTTELTGAFRGWPAVIGDADFARKAMEGHEVRVHRRHRQADYGEVLDRVADAVCAQCGIARETLFRRGWGDVRTQARSQFCHRAHVDELIPQMVIARYLLVTVSAVAALLKRGMPV